LGRVSAELDVILVRNGGMHDWYTNPKNKQSQPVPRHNEISENLAKSIVKKLSNVSHHQIWTSGGIALSLASSHVSAKLNAIQKSRSANE